MQCAAREYEIGRSSDGQPVVRADRAIVMTTRKVKLESASWQD